MTAPESTGKHVRECLLYTDRTGAYSVPPAQLDLSEFSRDDINMSINFG